MLNSTPVALSVAGSDCSAGAGAQADLKTFSAHGVYGLTALTCIVAEVPGKVTRIDNVAADMLAEQIRILLDSFPVFAMKTGMVPTQEHVHAICSSIDVLPKSRRPLMVVDPVMVATSGDRLIDEPAIAALKAELFPRATLITPNMDEASVLLGTNVANVADLEPAARALARQFNAAVLVKGGHLNEGIAIDCLVDLNGTAETFEAPFLPDRHTHGTGCTLSSAITSQLALGKSLPAAVGIAKRFVFQAIDHLMRWESDQMSRIDALNHFDLPETS